MDVKVRKVFRSRNLIGIPVKTPELKSIGEIEEVVLDVQSGKIVYGVLGFGGHFGFGENFFAVPWDEFKLVHDEKERYFSIDTSREKLKRLQGFNKADWPDFTDANWDKDLLADYEDEDSFDEAD